MIDLPGESLALIAVALLVTVFAPRLLVRDRLIVRRPRLVIGLWVAALSIATVALLGGTGLLIRDAVAREVGGGDPEQWGTTVAGSILAWASLATLGILAFRILDAAQNLWAERRAGIAQIAPLLRNAKFIETDSDRLYVVTSDEIVLTSLPFDNAVLISTAAHDALVEKTEYEAAIEHERAHLRGKHSMLVFASRLAMGAAGGFRASQRFTQAIRIAIELVADDEAARNVGPESLANALETLFPELPDVHQRVRRLHTRITEQ